METNYHERVHHSTRIPAMIAILNQHNMKQYFPSDIVIPSHWHRSLEITLVENMEVYLRIGEQETKIENDFTCVNSGVVHSLRSGKMNSDARCIILIISYDFIRQHIPEFDNLYFDFNKVHDHTPLKQLYYHLQDMYLCSTPYAYLSITACLIEILRHLLEHYQSPREAIKDLTYRNQEQMKAVLSYVHEHYQEELTLQDTAKLFHISKEYFSRRFHRQVGKTFIDYVAGYRLYKAFDDVVHSDMAIQDIARKHGFYNVRSFIRRFHEAYDETPLKYRKQCQENDIK